MDDSPSDDQSIVDPEDLQAEATSDDEETPSSERTSSDSSSSTSSLPNMSDTEKAAADMAKGMMGGLCSESEWYLDVSTTDDETGQRVIVSRPVPKHDGSQGPA